MPTHTGTPPARRSSPFDSLPDKVKIRLWTEYEDKARESWEQLPESEQLQKVLDFCKEDEAALPRARCDVPEPWCSPYVPGPDASTGKAEDPHDLERGALAQRCLFS